MGDQIHIIKNRYIASSPRTEKLYKLETKLTECVKLAAAELVQVVKADSDEELDLYTEAIPETLAMLCDAFSSDLQIIRKDK